MLKEDDIFVFIPEAQWLPASAKAFADAVSLAGSGVLGPLAVPVQLFPSILKAAAR